MVNKSVRQKTRLLPTKGIEDFQPIICPYSDPLRKFLWGAKPNVTRSLLVAFFFGALELTRKLLSFKDDGNTILSNHNYYLRSQESGVSRPLISIIIVI